MILLIGYRNVDAQYSSSRVLFGEIRIFVSVLTSACLSGFLVLGFFSPLFGDTAGFFYTPVAFWLLKQKSLAENLNYSTDVDVDLSRDPGLIRALRCYRNMGMYVATAVFHGFSLMMGLTQRHGRSSS